MTGNEFGVKAIGVKSLSTDKLKPNPHNPRKLFDREDMTVLRDSIKNVGILVPLTVYQESRTGDYVILDGQRRWMCAQDVGLKKIPVNEVAEPTLVQNIVTMFQIHKLRKDWELMPTALKLELLMNELDEVNERRLAELTGLAEAVVVRCKKLLSYKKRYQDMMLDADPEKRVKADFFIELHAVRNDREVNKFSWFKKDKFTDDMLKKIENKGIKAVTDFRIVKQHINNAVKVKKTTAISKRLQEFAENPSLTPDHLNIESAQVAAEAKKVLKSADNLYSQINDLDVDDFYGEEAMWSRLESLAKLIRDKLRSLEPEGKPVKQPHAPGTPIDAKRYSRWISRFGSYRAGVINATVQSWLEQFDPADRDLAARILDVVEYYGQSQIHAAYRQALGALNGWHSSASKRKGNWRFAAMSGSAGESGDRMLHDFRLANNLDAKSFNKLFISRSDLVRENLAEDDTVVLLDDFSGTGTQVCNAWTDPETAFGELLAGVGKVYLIVVAASKAAREKITAETAISLMPAHELDEGDNVFSEKCIHFTKTDQAKLLHYGKIADKKRPMGFGDCGFVVVFQHRVPNNSIPILHADHTVWTGLFPRHA